MFRRELAVMQLSINYSRLVYMVTMPCVSMSTCCNSCWNLWILDTSLLYITYMYSGRYAVGFPVYSSSSRYDADQSSVDRMHSVGSKDQRVYCSVSLCSIGRVMAPLYPVFI